MNKKAQKNHFIPAFLLRNFRNLETQNQISYLTKENWQVESRNITSANQYYNIKRFYSERSLNEIKSLCSDLLEVNPIFDQLDKDLETNLSSLESKISEIVKKILLDYTYLPKLTEIQLLKEYFIVQHLRTRKFKSDFHKYTSEFPLDFEEELIEEIRNSRIDFRDVIAEQFPHLNPEERDNLYQKYLDFQEKNPDYYIDILKTKPELLEEVLHKFRTMFNKVFNSDESQSIFIINKESRDNFDKITRLKSRNYTIIINNTDVPFLLSDSGVLETDDSEKDEQNLFLPISPKYCIAFTDSKNTFQEVDLAFVEQFNKFIIEESLFVVFGEEEILKEIKQT